MARWWDRLRGTPARLAERKDLKLDANGQPIVVVTRGSGRLGYRATDGDVVWLPPHEQPGPLPDEDERHGWTVERMKWR